MKRLLILAAMTYGQISMAHYECKGICKYTFNGDLKSMVISGSGDSHSQAYSIMRDSCLGYCDSGSVKECSVVNYSCSTPGHLGNIGVLSEILDIYKTEVSRTNSR
jgi:hypothetical protein